MHASLESADSVHCVWGLSSPIPLIAQEKPIVGLIPKAQKPITMDGNLDEWDGAFVTPVHVGHPDFANRGGQFLFLWDEQNLYIGLRCLDQHPAHVGSGQPNLERRCGRVLPGHPPWRQLGAAQFGPGTLHMFWTPFTKTEVKPRMQVRDLPAFKDFKLQGAEVAGAKTAVGLHRRVQAAVGQLPGLRRQGRRSHRHRLRTVQQRRRATSGSHLRLFLACCRLDALCVWPGATGGQDSTRRR